jgi:hypothetical protein
VAADGAGRLPDQRPPDRAALTSADQAATAWLTAGLPVAGVQARDEEIDFAATGAYKASL